MIIVLNGYPGVGKLTIGRKLAPVLRGRLLDIHAVYNVAFALLNSGRLNSKRQSRRLKLSRTI